MRSAGARASTGFGPREPVVSRTTDGIRFGPVSVRVGGSDGRLIQACSELEEGFAPPGQHAAATSIATVILDRHAQRAPELTRDVTAFAYEARGDVYIRANARVHLELRLEGSDVRLSAGVRPGERMGGFFPRHLLGTAAAVAAVQADALLVHGCAMVNPRGEAFLFLGASGDGKTTMTRRLPGWTSLADDSVLLELSDHDEGVWVSGTPFAGSEGLPRWGERHRLARLVVLEPHASTLTLTPIDPTRCFTEVLQRVFCPLVDGPVPLQVVELAERLSQRVGGALLASNLEHDVATLLQARSSEKS